MALEATPPLAPICPQAVAATRASFDRAARKWLGDASPAPQSNVGFCVESAAGAWRIEMPSLADVSDEASFVYAVEARYVVVFEPRNGPRATRLPKETLSNYGVRVKHAPIVFDFDGDGVPELHHRVDEQGDEGHRAQQSELLSFRGGAIVPYPKAVAFSELRDVDGDGRPDLVRLAGYDEVLESCAAGFPFAHPDPLFVAHSLSDGSFSTDDAAAKAFVKTWCAAPPSTITSSSDAICARLWGKPRSLVTTSCIDFSCESDMAGKPQSKSATQDCARRRAFYDRTPPFTLP
ncbi:MAG: FG-GAP repeat domain-containing protein [Polyangiales bacterium]